MNVLLALCLKQRGQGGGSSERRHPAVGAPVSAARAALPDLYEQGRAGKGRRGHAGAGREVEREGARPRSVTPGAETRPHRPDRRDDAGPARRPTSIIPRLTAAGACCQGRMKSSPREAFNCNYEARARRLQVWERGGRPAPVPALHSALLGAPEPSGCRDGEAGLAPSPAPAPVLEFRLLPSLSYSSVGIFGVAGSKCTFLVAMSKQPP